MVLNPGLPRKKMKTGFHVFEMTCLRRILGVSRLDKIRNTKIKESLNLDQDVLNKQQKGSNTLATLRDWKPPDTQKCQWKAMSKGTDPEFAHQKDG